MTKRQILALFVCSFVPWTVGNGLVPLLPVYATQLGADPAVAGYYLAFAYFAIALGAISAGWVSDKFQRRKNPIIIAGLAGIPVAWLTGQVGSIWSLSLLTAALWFCGGLGLGLIGILTGLSAAEDERGKIFGILSLTTGLGALVGGLGTGFLVDRWGFPTMFTATAVYLILWPLSGLFLTEKAVAKPMAVDETPKERPGFGKSYYLFFAASLISAISGFTIVLGRSILMNDLGFKALEISSTGAISGLVAMPLPFLMGWLSDRTGRKAYIYLGYCLGILSLSILVVSIFLWHFILASVLMAIFTGIPGAVGNALVTDLLPSESLGKGLALFGATGWIGGILGFAGAGYAIQSLGPKTTFMITIGLLLVAVLLLIPVREKQPST